MGEKTVGQRKIKEKTEGENVGERQIERERKRKEKTVVGRGTERQSGKEKEG